jgi:hypothetical protein
LEKIFKYKKFFLAEGDKDDKEVFERICKSLKTIFPDNWETLVLSKNSHIQDVDVLIEE